MIGHTSLGLGLMTLALVWLGLPSLALAGSFHFSAHMTMHMGVVAVAAPLLALAMAGGRFDPVRKTPALFSVIPASLFELAAVWSWHAPRLHHAARHHFELLLLEQATFLGAGLWLWLSAFGGSKRHRATRAWGGVMALLFTSMHMTLLGALFALAPRPLYADSDLVSSALADQHLGGAIMLTVGGISYLAGGMWLAAEGLNSPWCNSIGIRTAMRPGPTPPRTPRAAGTAVRSPRRPLCHDGVAPRTVKGGVTPRRSAS